MATLPKNLETPMRATVRYGHDNHTFDPGAWLADWSDHGGIVMHIGQRLWVGRMPGLDSAATRRLDAIRGAIMHPDAATALSGALRGLREVGEDA